MNTYRIQQLIETLEKAVANKESHAKAQDDYFSDVEEAPLTHCGTACCIAGDIAMRVALEKGFLGEEYGTSQVVEALQAFFRDKQCDGPWDFAQMYYGLSDLEALLVFNTGTHWRIHQTLAEIFKQGLRLPQGKVYKSDMCGDYLDFVGVGFAWDRDTTPNRFTDMEEFCRYLKTLAAPSHDIL
jgi:hypothetical protein